MMNSGNQKVGVIVIGRNEGERLTRCLLSLAPARCPIVYVDSGSIDGSLDVAGRMGHDALALDPSAPFSAARARNAGLRRLLDRVPGVDYVQFVDGDCELVDGWLEAACRFLEGRPDVACVCGRLRERHPRRSIYNELCDLEWDRPVGEATECGGVAMMRAGVVAAAGGFREGLIAGEEPELCLRLRAQGWKVWRLADPMAWHDADMTHFRQWWRRAKRGGHALAEASALHGGDGTVSYRAKLLRTLAWGFALPVGTLALAATSPWWLLLACAYPAQVLRLALRGGIARRASWLEAAFHTIAKFPEAMGACRYWVDRLTREPARVIEYK